MAVIGFKKTLNLHKYSVKVNDFISNWKFILPVIFAISGLFIGCFTGKGQGGAYQKITEYFTSIISVNAGSTVLSEFIKALLLPTVFAAIAFFLGLCVFGGLIVNTVPMAYGFLIGVISYYLYLNYTLKGLAYCVILIFPYAVISLFAIIMFCRESISMSECLIKSISKSNKFCEYNFSVYYKKCLKNYLTIILSAIVKAVLDYLFIGLFSF